MITIGADIHVHCEYRDRDGVWINCDNFEWNQEFGKYEFVSVYWYRNYVLFGTLAGVRDVSYGTISEPKGLPKDMSPKTKEFADEWEGDAHSYSYLTMRELLKWRENKIRKWKKLKKKYKVTHDEYDEDYILDDNNSLLMFKGEKTVLNTLIRRLKDKMIEHLYCCDEEDFYERIK